MADKTNRVHIQYHISDILNHLSEHTAVKKALEFIKHENDWTVNDQIELTKIPSPTGFEEVRGKAFAEKLNQYGLRNVSSDEAGNVSAVRKGSGHGPTVVLSAHLDTVFPAETDVEPKFKNGMIYAPGIADDGRGLAVVLTVLKTMNEWKLQTAGDVIFLATTGEEGLGDLKGVKHFFSENDGIDGFISIEPGFPSRIIYKGVGSKRYEVTYKGPGGHSFADFGLPSAVHAAGRAVADISVLEVSSDPKTTFNVGEIRGGTTVNTIASEASLIIDLRSTSQEELRKLEGKVLEICRKAAEKETESAGSAAKISCQLRLVGDRPAGMQPVTSPIVQCAAAATAAVNFTPEPAPPGSTDSNVPISLGVPAVTLGGGGEFGGIHTLDEYFNPAGAFSGPQQILLTLLALAGLKNVTSPILEKRKI